MAEFSQSDRAPKRERTGRLLLACVVAVALFGALVIATPNSSSAQEERPFVPLGRIFAPGTDPNVIRDSQVELLQRLVGPQAAQISSHWDPAATALNEGGGAQGESLALTWSIIPDGTPMPGLAGEADCNSNLVASFDDVFGPGNWQVVLEAVFENWAESTGNTYAPGVTRDTEGTPIDDGASWPYAAGVYGARGDIRLGGCAIDGDLNTLAYATYPNLGDMKIDTEDVWYTTAALTPDVHNVWSHELGHTLGLDHVCPVDGTKLMEPYLNTSFLGLQHDDLRGAHRLYGDRFELVESPNDTRVASTPTGIVGGVDADQTELNLSLDGNADDDWFRLDGLVDEVINVTVAPRGSSYLEGPTGALPDPNPGNLGVCDIITPQLIDSATIQDLSFELRTGSGLLLNVDDGGDGDSESLTDFTLPATGAYYVRVKGSGVDDAQLYDLTIQKSSALAKLGGRVWEDTNANGLQDDGEPRVQGQLVEVIDGDGLVVRQVTTGPNGNWSVMVDANVAWTLRFPSTVGFAFTSPNAGADDTVDSDADSAGMVDVPLGSLSPGGTNTTFDVGLVAASGSATIGNRVWDDLDGNGRYNNAEPGVGGVTVEIRDSGGALVMTRTTNPNGFWTAEVATGQSWNLHVLAPAGKGFTLRDVGPNDNVDSDADPSGLITIAAGELTPGQENKTFDAGLVDDAGPATIGNRVWNDLDENGRPNNGEPGAGGVIIEILDAGGSVVQTRTTSGNGFWTADVDPAQSWTLRVLAPAGKAFTLSDVGSNDNADSDADSAGIIEIPAGTLSPGEENKTFDAGLVDDGGPATIGNRVWDDLDGNGKYNNSEPGVGGVTVRIRNSAGAVVATQTTNANGFWSAQVDAGQAWSIRVVAPAGKAFTLKDVGSNDNIDSDVNASGVVAIPVGTLTPGGDHRTFDAGLVPG